METKDLQELRPPVAVKLSPGSTVSAAKPPKMKMSRVGETEDKRQINYLPFGESESGKTSIAAMLAKAGLKVFVLFTDLGNDNGISGAQVYAKLKNSNTEFRNNVAWVALDDLDTVEKFIDDPEKLVDGFWDFNADFLLWDGFSFHQQMNIIPDVEEDINSRDSSEGSFETFKGWGVTKNRTVRTLGRFLSIRNPNSKPLHKVVTCAVKYASQQVGPDKSEVRAKHEPDISGAASKFIRYGFDVVFETERSKEGFSYRLDTSSATKRRFELGEKLPADFVALHNKILEQVKG